jgi:hypothetical protein
MLVAISMVDAAPANQFLARRNIHRTFKQTGLRYSSRQLLSLRYGGVDMTRRIGVPACQIILVCS